MMPTLRGSEGAEMFFICGDEVGDHIGAGAVGDQFGIPFVKGNVENARVLKDGEEGVSGSAIGDGGLTIGSKLVHCLGMCPEVFDGGVWQQFVG